MEPNSYPNMPSGQPYQSWETSARKEKAARNLALASMIFGVISLVCSCFIYPAFMAGGVAVVLAFLSRRKGSPTNSMAIAGMVSGFLGLALGIYMLISSVIALFTDPRAHQMLNDMSQQIYGESFDDLMEGMYGDAYDEFLPGNLQGEE